MTDTLKTFHLGDLLSLTTTKLLAPTHMQGLTDLIEHLIGRRLENDVDLLVMSSAARAKLVTQHPWLADTVVPNSDDKNELMTWFAYEVVSRGGAHQVIGIEITKSDAIEMLDADTSADVVPVTDEVIEPITVPATVEGDNDE